MTTTDANHAATDHSGHGHHAKPSYDDINVPVLTLVVLISAIVTIVIVAFVQGLAYRWNDYYMTEKVYKRQNEAAVRMQSEQGENLMNVTEAGRISIEDAKQRVLERFGESN